MRSIFRTYGGSYYNGYNEWAAENVAGGGGGGGMANGGTDVGDGGRSSGKDGKDNRGGFTTKDPKVIAAIFQALWSGGLFISQEYFGIPNYEVLWQNKTEVRLRETSTTWVALDPDGGANLSSGNHVPKLLMAGLATRRSPLG